MRQIFRCLSLIALGACGRPPDSTIEPTFETDRIMAPPRPAWCQEGPRPAYAELTRVDVSSDWFEVYGVGLGVFAIYEPFQFEEVLSYLILGNDRALLFDTGLGIGPMREVVEQLTSLPVSVLNSHSHLDHVGGNADFDEVLALDTAFGRENARGLANDEVSATLDAEALCADLLRGVEASTYRIRAYEISRYVEPGEILDLGARQLEIVATPGHTPDALMLLDRANGLLFTGDSFYEGPIYLFAPETDRAAYRASIDRVASLVGELELLLPGHNTPTADPARLLELQSALDAIESGRTHGSAQGEHVEYHFGDFSILMSSGKINENSVR